MYLFSEVFHVIYYYLNPNPALYFTYLKYDYMLDMHVSLQNTFVMSIHCWHFAGSSDVWTDNEIQSKSSNPRYICSKIGSQIKISVL